MGNENIRSKLFFKRAISGNLVVQGIRYAQDKFLLMLLMLCFSKTVEHRTKQFPSP